MEIAEYKNIFENEERHFFYVANHNIILSLLKKYLKTSQKILKILDAGCGTGYLAKRLEKYGQVWGIDINPYAISFAKRRGVKVKKSSVTKIPFQTNNFDVVVSVDVIYHKEVRDDKKAIREFLRVLKPGGILILRVPANKWLKLTHDRHVHTRERYDKKELRNKLIKVGFRIEKLSFVNSLLLPIAVIQQIWENIFQPESTSSAIGPLPSLINKTLTHFLSIERDILLKIDLPFGIGLIAVCRKPLYG